MKILFTLLLISTSFLSFSQSAISLEDSKPVIHDGYEYGFSIDKKTGWTSLISRKKYEEYVVTFYVKNRSIANHTSLMYSDGKNVVCDPLAEFNCLNAIDKRDGVSNLVVYGKPKTIPVPEKEYQTSYYNSTPIVFSKDIKKEVLIGYVLPREELVSATVTVVIPQGEAMKMRVKPYGK